tara:strand:+ start:16464 stop:17897 length:1434 start_codon:yes stop_codon:yes gene_type:complete
MLIASYIGPGAMTDAFFLAFRLPNTFRRIFAEGAFNAAFVPIFTKIWHRHPKAAALFVSNTLVFLSLVLVGLSILFEIFMPQVMAIIAMGFSKNQTFDLVVHLGRIMFPYIIFISLASLFMSVLNSLNKFAVTSASSIILNISAILSLTLFFTSPLQAVFSLSWSIPISGILQLSLVGFVAHKHLKISLFKPRWTPTIKRLFQKILPGIYGAGIYQINLLTSDIIASFIPSGISYLSFADRINQFPLGLIGASMGLVVLPELSRYISQNNAAEALKTMNKGIIGALYLAIPCAFGIFTLAPNIVQSLFKYGHFTAADVTATSLCLKAFIIGLPAFVLVKVLTNAYFARGDTHTPMILTSFILGTNIVINIVLAYFYSYVGIAVGTSIAYWLQVVVLITLLKKNQWFQLTKSLQNKILACIVSAFIMMLALVLMRKSDYLAIIPIHQLQTAILIGLGVAIYLAASQLMGLNLKRLRTG